MGWGDFSCCGLWSPLLRTNIDSSWGTWYRETHATLSLHEPPDDGRASHFLFEFQFTPRRDLPAAGSNPGPHAPGQRAASGAGIDRRERALLVPGGYGRNGGPHFTTAGGSTLPAHRK